MTRVPPGSGLEGDSPSEQGAADDPASPGQRPRGAIRPSEEVLRVQSGLPPHFWVMVRALVFDFDGLILDTEVPVYQAWAEVYQQHGQELSLDFWKTIVGHGMSSFDAMAELERRLGRTLDRQAVRTAHRRRQLDLVNALPIAPGVLAWRDEATLRGAALGLASNSTRAWVVGHLERLGLDGWQCICCAEDVGVAKPAADIYVAVLRCLGVNPGEAIALEDSAAGVQSAKAAGLYVVAVPSTLTADHDLSGADLVLPSLADATFSEVARRAAG